MNIQLIAEQIKGATVVSSSAVQRGTVGTFVYVVTAKDDQKVASVRQVEIGLSERGLANITKGINPGEQVVVDGVDKLREGSTVELVSRSTDAGGAAEPKPGRTGGKRPRDGAKPQN